MKFVSTRGGGKPLSFSDTLMTSLAPDGGLYVPESFPHLDIKHSGLLDVAQAVLKPFFEGDELAPQLNSICAEAFSFPITLKKLDSNHSVLELFHGPTCAFKDVGARFLAECLTRLDQKTPRTILVATSGDTGGAVAAAFFKKSGTRVWILYPKGRISARQEKQLTAWGENVSAFRVNGTFDNCQAIAKAAFQDSEFKTKWNLTSANSINIGRILPQMVYYAWASLEFMRLTGREAGFVIPTGNLGNAVAALWVKKMGLPIRHIAFACNSNRALVDYFEKGKWKPHGTVATLANAMDVGNPSNFERLNHHYPDLNQLKADTSAYSISDNDIRKTIAACQWEQIWCPHTATAVNVVNQLDSSKDWIIVATAHPAKFDTVVEPLIKKSIPIPLALEAILQRPSHAVDLEPTLKDFKSNWSHSG